MFHVSLNGISGGREDSINVQEGMFIWVSGMIHMVLTRGYNVIEVVESIVVFTRGIDRSDGRSLFHSISLCFFPISGWHLTGSSSRNSIAVAETKGRLELGILKHFVVPALFFSVPLQ